MGKLERNNPCYNKKKMKGYFTQSMYYSNGELNTLGLLHNLFTQLTEIRVATHMQMPLGPGQTDFIH